MSLFYFSSVNDCGYGLVLIETDRCVNRGLIEKAEKAARQIQNNESTDGELNIIESRSFNIDSGPFSFEIVLSEDRQSAEIKTFAGKGKNILIAESESLQVD